MPSRQVAEAEEAVWVKDRTHNLIVRLRHNVIRAGLFRISLAYWRISLADVAAKLGACCLQRQHGHRCPCSHPTCNAFDARADAVHVAVRKADASTGCAYAAPS